MRLDFPPAVGVSPSSRALHATGAFGRTAHPGERGVAELDIPCPFRRLPQEAVAEISEVADG